MYENLPSDIICDIALNNSRDDIIRFCLVNTKFYYAIWNNEDFWRMKVAIDYPNLQKYRTWKFMYSNPPKLYTFGSGPNGQLGHGDNIKINVPTSIVLSNFLNITAISCGRNYTAMIANGRLYTFGDGQYGKLGHGDTNDIHIPKIVPDLFNVTAVSCGESHTAVIANGKLYTFGFGGYGQLGHRDSMDVIVPKPIKNFLNITAVSCGYRHTAMIMNGKLYTFGLGSNGQLGHGNKNNLYIPTLVTNLSNVTAISCYSDHTAVIANNQIYTFGSGKSGRLGHGNFNDLTIPTPIPNFTNVTSISCGNGYTAMIANNQLYTFGDSSYGELGQGVKYESNLNIPTLVVFSRNEKSLSSISFSRDTDNATLQDVTAVSCGNDHTAVIANNKLYTFGRGYNNQLGHGNRENVYIPEIVAGLQHVIAVSCGCLHTAVISY